MFKIRKPQVFLKFLTFPLAQLSAGSLISERLFSSLYSAMDGLHGKLDANSGQWPHRRTYLAFFLALSTVVNGLLVQGLMYSPVSMTME